MRLSVYLVALCLCLLRRSYSLHLLRLRPQPGLLHVHQPQQQQQLPVQLPPTSVPALAAQQSRGHGGGHLPAGQGGPPAGPRRGEGRTLVHVRQEQHHQ